MTEPAHILVVDDDPSIRRLMQLLFGDAGYRVSTASTGEEALAFLDLVTPDLIMLDLNLPGISGQEVTERIKSDPQRPFIPIILVTAHGDTQSKLTGFDAGADDYLTKPVDLSEMLARAKVMLRLQRSQRSLRAEQRKTELLLHLSRELNTSLDLDQLLKNFLRQLANAVGAARASLILTTERRPRFYSSSANQPTVTVEEILRDGIAGWVLREGQAANIRDTRHDQRWKATTHSQRLVRSAAAMPIRREGRNLGVVTLVHHTPSYFTDEHLDLLASVAAQAALAVEHAELYHQVEAERSTLNAVLEGAADPILLISPQEKLLLANQAAATELLVSGASGTPISEVVAQPNLLQLLSLPTPSAGPSTTPPEITLTNGKTYSISVAPVHGANREPIGRVAILQNITAIKELERREQERLRSVVRRYVSPQVAEQVLAGGGAFGDPIERDIAVIFADLRGYTALTEGIAPGVLVGRILNRYFTAMTDVFYRYEGTVDKFLGDGILGVFGTPLAHSDDLPRALCSAVELQQAFNELRVSWLAELGLDIGLGVGVAYGRAVVGNIGSVQRLDYTVIGDVVNTASRLNGIARAGQIIVSYNLIDALPPDWVPPWPLLALDQVQLKGKQQLHQIYQVDYEAVLTRVV